MYRLGVGLLLIALPVIELWLLFKTGQVIGFWATLAIVIAAGVAGMAILSRQSFAVLSQLMRALNTGRAPNGGVLDGALLLVAGVLLLVPGLLSDAVGLCLLIRPIRHLVARLAVSGLRRRVGARMTGDVDWRPYQTDPSLKDGPVIEGEFQRLGERPAPKGDEDSKRS